MDSLETAEREMLPFTGTEHQEAHQFLVVEAQLLDDRRFRQWLDLMTEDVTYSMPVAVTTAADADPVAGNGMAHFHEDLFSLRKRVERFETEHAWTEDPPSRTRHFVTNVRTFRGTTDDEMLVRSYLLLFRSRGDIRDSDLVSAERIDTLRFTADGWRLTRRVIHVDESVLRTQNLAVFL